MSAIPLSAEIEPHRQFVTREFADLVSGKNPRAYFRTHDTVQEFFIELVEERAGWKPPWHLFADRFIHFFREISLFEIPRVGRDIDESCALALEAGFDLGRCDQQWREAFLAEGQIGSGDFRLLELLGAHWCGYEVSHRGIREAITDIHAPKRERGEITQKVGTFFSAVEAWFRAGAAASCTQDVEDIRPISDALAGLSTRDWEDKRLHTQIVRRAPRLSQLTPRIELLAHPLFRLFSLKHTGFPLETAVAAEFLNLQCIASGWETENDYFTSDLELASWVRDARAWARCFRRERPKELRRVFREVGSATLERYRSLFSEVIGPAAHEVDDITATRRLIAWNQAIRGTKYSRSRGEFWEAITHCVDAALWLGWLLDRGEKQSTLTLPKTKGD